MKRDSLASIMNWSKNLYVFMLGALIVFSGCFGTGTTDGEGDDDDAVGTTVINYYNNTTVDELEWFSQGGVVDVEFTSQFNDNGNNLLSNYNTTECINLGGSPHLQFVTMTTMMVCDIALTTITTQSGQMLVIHERVGFSLNTTCDGQTVAVDGSTSTGEWRAPGHAMDCTHELYINDVVPTDASFGHTNSPVLWSVAYSFRAVTVV